MLLYTSLLKPKLALPRSEQYCPNTVHYCLTLGEMLIGSLFLKYSRLNIAFCTKQKSQSL